MTTVGQPASGQESRQRSEKESLTLNFGTVPRDAKAPVVTVEVDGLKRKELAYRKKVSPKPLNHRKQTTGCWRGGGGRMGVTGAGH